MRWGRGQYIPFAMVDIETQIEIHDLAFKLKWRQLRVRLKAHGGELGSEQH